MLIKRRSRDPSLSNQSRRRASRSLWIGGRFVEHVFRQGPERRSEALTLLAETPHLGPGGEEKAEQHHRHKSAHEGHLLAKETVTALVGQRTATQVVAPAARR